MKNNPYSPPLAEVRDPVVVNPHPPRAVRNSCWLIVGSFVVGLVTLFPGMRAVPAGISMASYVAITVATLAVFGAITLWLTIKVLRRRNWARWTMLVYQALMWALGSPTIVAELQPYPQTAAIDIACFIMVVIGCALLFFGPGGRWFASRDIES